MVGLAVKVGAQLYSVRKALAKDLYGTLQRVAESGYRYVEAANPNPREDPGIGFGLPALEAKKLLGDLGLKVIGSHIGGLQPDTIEPVLDYHAELGNPQIGCPIEFFPAGDLDAVLRHCERFNAIGEKCRARGIRFYYHNHFNEFQKINGRYVFDILMENTDPDLVFVELDTYWVARAGVDPLEVMRKYQDRLILLHQKDFPADAPQPLVLFGEVVDPEANLDGKTFGAAVDPRSFTEIGTGILPIQNIIDEAALMPHLGFIIVEQDHTQLDELESIRKSREALGKYRGISLEA